MSQTSRDYAAMVTYQRLRREGEIVLSYEEKFMIGRLRTRAKKDGLNISQYKMRPERDSAISVALVHPDNPTTIVRPDAGKGEEPTVAAVHDVEVQD